MKIQKKDFIGEKKYDIIKKITGKEVRRMQNGTNQPERNPKKPGGQRAYPSANGIRSALKQSTYPETPYQSRAARVRQKQTRAVSGLAAFLITMIAVSVILLAVRSVDWDSILHEQYRFPFDETWAQEYGPYLDSAEHDALTTVYAVRNAKDIYDGPCILINPTHEYHFTEEDNVINVYKNKTKSYMVNSGSELLTRDTVDALNAMMDDFYAETENRTVMLNSGWRSLEGQQKMIDYYRETKGQEYVDLYMQKPGYSEHHSGYAFDLSVYVEDGEYSAMWQFDGKGEYFWINQHAEQYGIILRYSASKEAVTGVSYASWHFRYVGRGNAIAMTQMGTALEEYITIIRDYTYSGKRYSAYADNGDRYVLYYVPSTGKDNQKIPIPANADSYEISGNNEDGFIVAACYLNQT